jgi:hypothetical protein
MGIVTLIDAVIAKLVADEIKARLPRLSRSIIKCAVGRLPVEQRARYGEEWEAHLLATDGDLSQLVCSVGFLHAALRITAAEGRKARGSRVGAEKSKSSELAGPEGGITQPRKLVVEMLAKNEAQQAITEEFMSKLQSAKESGKRIDKEWMKKQVRAQAGMTLEAMEQTRQLVISLSGVYNFDPAEFASEVDPDRLRDMINGLD